MIRAENDRGDWGGRGSGIHSEGILMIFLSFEEILKVGTKKTIEHHPDPSIQNCKNQKSIPKRIPKGIPRNPKEPKRIQRNPNGKQRKQRKI